MPLEVFARTLHHWMMFMWLVGFFTGGVLVVTLYLAHYLWGVP